MLKPELLIPAGDIEKLHAAINFGADAVYVGLKDYSLRAKDAEMDLAQIKEAAEICGKKGVKLFVAINNYPNSQEIQNLKTILDDLVKIPINALIVADVGVLNVLIEKKIKIDIHISTQANNINKESLKFWSKLRIKRVVLAREMNIEEVKEIRKELPHIEIEMFIHGAMCISYSGRCLLSKYMTNRDANSGLCSHSCRWEYDLVEKTRPENKYTIEENEKGTFIFNSKDLCLINELKQLMEIGITSFKIEGRMKTTYYVALATKVYREVIDKLYKNEEIDYTYYQNELSKISNRGYTTGFFYGMPKDDGYNYQSSKYQKSYDFVGMVEKYNKKSHTVTVNVRNKIKVGDIIEFIDYQKPEIEKLFIDRIENTKNKEELLAAHNSYNVEIPCPFTVSEGSVIRRAVYLEDHNKEKPTEIILQGSKKSLIYSSILVLMATFFIVTFFLMANIISDRKDNFAGDFSITAPRRNFKTDQQDVVFRGRIKNIKKIYIGDDFVKINNKTFRHHYVLTKLGRNRILITLIDKNNNFKRIYYEGYRNR